MVHILNYFLPTKLPKTLPRLVQICCGIYTLYFISVLVYLFFQFNDKTPYTIMFGPDKCGNDIKMHFIFRHVNPINGSITEKHCRKPK